jgi:membrane protein DedA with SNARE-associated domain
MFDAVALWKYGSVFGTLILAGFGLPVPEEIPVVTAGAMVGHDANEVAYHDDLAGALGGGPIAYLDPDPIGLARWWVMLPVCILGVVLGDCVIYTAGRLWGRRLLRSGWVQRHVLPPDKQVKIEQNFAKNGILILLGARLTPGIRTPVFLMAGVLKMPLARFLLADGLYAIPGVNLLFWLAYLFTDQFVEAIRAVERHRPMAIAVALAAVGGVVLYKLLVRRKLSTGDVEEIPPYVKPVGKVTHAVEQAIEMAAQKTVQTIPRVVDRVTHPLGHKATPVGSTPELTPSAEPGANGRPAEAEPKAAESPAPAGESRPTPG